MLMGDDWGMVGHGGFLLSHVYVFDGLTSKNAAFFGPVKCGVSCENFWRPQTQETAGISGFECLSFPEMAQKESSDIQ